MDTIFEKLGFPKNNSNMDINSIISSILATKHPSKPKVSDLSGEEFSEINPDKKAVIAMLDENGPMLFSNIIVATKQEIEELNKSLFKEYKVNIHTNALVKIGATFYLPSMDLLNKQIENISKMPSREKYKSICDKVFELEIQKLSFNLFEFFADLDNCTKGLVSVFIEGNGITSTISATDIMKYIQNN